jgi:hypothetical protein
MKYLKGENMKNYIALAMGLTLTSCNPATFAVVEKEAEVAIEAAEAAEVVATTSTKETTASTTSTTNSTTTKVPATKEVNPLPPQPGPKPRPKAQPKQLDPLCTDCLKTQEI